VSEAVENETMMYVEKDNDKILITSARRRKAASKGYESSSKMNADRLYIRALSIANYSAVGFGSEEHRDGTRAYMV
jgi:hypothetical protein